MGGKFIWLLFLALALVAVIQCKATERAEKAPEEAKEDADSEEEKEDADEELSGESPEDADEDAAEDAEEKEFVCNLKYKRIGCYADKGKKDKPLASFMESDAEMGEMDKRGKLPKGSGKFNSELPKFACKCANDALNGGNAIFGLQNLAECWSGPDDSKYDKDGDSEECVTFDFAKCEGNSEICAGKKHANFMYYVDTPEHTKTADEITSELAENAKKDKEDAEKEKKAKKSKAKKNKKSKSKKAKKQN